MVGQRVSAVFVLFSSLSLYLPARAFQCITDDSFNLCFSVFPSDLVEGDVVITKGQLEIPAGSPTMTDAKLDIKFLNQSLTCRSPSIPPLLVVHGSYGSYSCTDEGDYHFDNVTVASGDYIEFYFAAIALITPGRGGFIATLNDFSWDFDEYMGPVKPWKRPFEGNDTCTPRSLVQNGGFDAPRILGGTGHVESVFWSGLGVHKWEPYYGSSITIDRDPRVGAKGNQVVRLSTPAFVQQSFPTTAGEAYAFSLSAESMRLNSSASPLLVEMEYDTDNEAESGVQYSSSCPIVEVSTWTDCRDVFVLNFTGNSIIRLRAEIPDLRIDDVKVWKVEPLRVQHALSNTSVLLGQNVVFTVTINNPGPDVEHVVFRHQLPKGLSCEAVQGQNHSEGFCSADNAAVFPTANTTFDMSCGETMVLDYHVAAVKTGTIVFDVPTVTHRVGSFLSEAKSEGPRSLDIVGDNMTTTEGPLEVDVQGKLRVYVHKAGVFLAQ